MADHYQTLGVDKTATPDEIKRAYRSLASKHHPDKGGDTAKFQEIQTAYATLSDPNKRAEYDNPAPQGFGFHSGQGVPPGFEDIFSTFGFGHMFGQRPQQARNRTMNLQTQLTLEEAFSGKELIANIQLPSGKEQLLEVKIPAGVKDGTVLRLSGMGDDTYANLPRGDIHLSVHINPHHSFIRNGDDLSKQLDVNCLEAIIGGTRQFDTIDGKTLEVNIPPGIQHGQMIAVQGYGMPAMADNRMKGRLLLVINITIPKTLTDQQKDLVRQILS